VTLRDARRDKIKIEARRPLRERGGWKSKDEIMGARMRDAINQKSRPDEGRFESGRDWRSRDEIIGALGADVIIGWSPALREMRQRRLGHWNIRPAGRDASWDTTALDTEGL